MEITNNTAIGLGGRGYKAGLSGDPMDDELFVNLIQSEDVPMVAAIASYIQGFITAKTKAESIVIDASDRFGTK